MALYNSIATGMGKYNILEASKINMLTKCIQIPAYIINFLFGCFGVVLSIWGMGVIAFVIIVDYITIVITGISSIGCSCYLKSKNVISSTTSILCGIGCFIYVVDVIVSIFYFIKAKLAYKNNREIIDIK